MTTGILFVAALLFMALLWVFWRRLTREWERRYFSERASSRPEEEVRDPLPKLSPATFPDAGEDRCANCQTPLPTEPTDDGLVHCAFCSSVIVTPASPEFFPIALQRSHAVRISDSSGQPTVHLDGQNYVNVRDILDAESRRVADWALARYFAKLTAARGAAEPHPGDSQSFAQEVERILRGLLVRDTLLRRKDISLHATPDGTLRIEVDGTVYSGVEQLPSERLRSLFREAIRRWEQSH
jgi:hypothetical protein